MTTIRKLIYPVEVIIQKKFDRTETIPEVEDFKQSYLRMLEF